MNLKNKLSGSYFTPQGLVTGTIPAGSSFVLLDVPEVEGVYYKLTSLWTDNPNSASGNFTFEVDGVTVSNHRVLSPNSGIASAQSGNWFMIASCFTGDGSVTGHARVYHEVLCSSFRLSNGGITTTQPIVYGYEIGKITA